MSLVLGSEYFDVNVKPMTNEENHYLLAHQTSSGILESHLKFTNNMTFRPSDLKSDTHRNLTAQIADKHVRKTRTKMFMTEQDPERVKQEAEMVRYATCFKIAVSILLTSFQSASKSDYGQNVNWKAPGVVRKIDMRMIDHFVMIMMRKRPRHMAAAMNTTKILLSMTKLSKKKRRRRRDKERSVLLN